MNNIKQSLIEYGLEKHETEVYLYLLKNKDSAVYAIAKGATLPRTNVYKILERLDKKGLVSSWSKNGIKHFSVENPDKLIRNLKEKESKINLVLPDLKNLYSLASIHPSSKVYIGKDGCQQAFEIILDVIKTQKLKQLYVYTDSKITNLFPKFYRDWRQRKDRTGAVTQIIVPHNTPQSEIFRDDLYRQIRMLPAEFSFSGSINICGTFAVFFSFEDKDPYAVVMDAKIVADILTQSFRYIWKTLEK
jgi:sugar-specific transcriptional regulator TrmB